MRGATITVKCQRCGEYFTAHVADRKRGWGRFCSKRCKAIKQTYGRRSTETKEGRATKPVVSELVAIGERCSECLNPLKYHGGLYLQRWLDKGWREGSPGRPVVCRACWAKLPDDKRPATYFDHGHGGLVDTTNPERARA